MAVDRTATQAPIQQAPNMRVGDIGYNKANYDEVKTAFAAFFIKMKGWENREENVKNRARIAAGEIFENTVDAASEAPDSTGFSMNLKNGLVTKTKHTLELESEYSQKSGSNQLWSAIELLQNVTGTGIVAVGALKVVSAITAGLGAASPANAALASFLEPTSMVLLSWLLLTEGALIAAGSLKNAKSGIVENIVGTVAFVGIGGSLAGWFGKFMGETAESVRTAAKAAQSTTSGYITTLSDTAKADMIAGAAEALKLAVINTSMTIHWIADACIGNPIGLALTMLAAIVVGAVTTTSRSMRERNVRVNRALRELTKKIEQATQEIGAIVSNLKIFDIVPEVQPPSEAGSNGTPSEGEIVI